MTQHPNPVLKKLGLDENERVAIIHTDDIGMCQANVDAFAELNEVGTISSGVVVAACPGSWRLPGSLLPIRRQTWAYT